MTFPDWLWIPITVWAAFAQTIRNAAQRHLTKELGTLGATLVRFLYGLPFAVLWLVLVQRFTGAAIPHAGSMFFVWVLLGAVSQIAATALLLRRCRRAISRSGWPIPSRKCCRSRSSR